MYPDLSYFLHDLIGTDPDNWTSVFKTFGLFLGLTFFVAAVVMYKELKRKEEEGFLHPTLVDISSSKRKLWMDIVMNSLIGAFFAFKLPYIIQHFETFKDDAAGTVFSSKGNLLTGIVGFAVLFGLHYWQSKNALTAKPSQAKKKVYPHQRVTDIVFVAALFGILGARLFSILENLDTFWDDPIGQLFSGSGLTIYGGFILGLGALYIYIRRAKIPVFHFLDALSLSYIIGYGIGRLGCHFSGDGDWGIVAAAQPVWWFLPDWLWSYEYPHNVADFYQRGPKLDGCTWKFCTYLDPKVYTTPVWESIANFMAFGIFWAFRRKIKVAGMLTAIYFIFLGAQRWWIETLRVNEKYEYLGLNWSQAQYISAVMIILGIIGTIYFSRKSPDVPVAEGA